MKFMKTTPLLLSLLSLTSSLAFGQAIDSVESAIAAKEARHVLLMDAEISFRGHHAKPLEVSTAVDEQLKQILHVDDVMTTAETLTAAQANIAGLPVDSECYLIQIKQNDRFRMIVVQLGTKKSSSKYAIHQIIGSDLKTEKEMLADTAPLFHTIVAAHQNPISKKIQDLKDLKHMLDMAGGN